MIYLILAFTHFVSDWFLQPSAWAEGKAKHFLPLFYHSIQYTALFIPVLWLLKINLLWLLLIFFLHLAIDNYRLIKWWNKSVRKIKWPLPDWFMTVQDQVLHLATLIPVAIVG